MKNEIATDIKISMFEIWAKYLIYWNDLQHWQKFDNSNQIILNPIINLKS